MTLTMRCQHHDEARFARRSERWEAVGQSDRHHRLDHPAQRGRRGRLFDQGELRLVLLHLIAEQPRHGYELIKAIEERVADAYSPSPGVIYPTLTMLDELGYVTVTEQDGKKRHAATAEGIAFLAANRDTADAALARMDAIAAARAENPAPPIVRAIENLRLALRLRLARGGLDEHQVRAIATALDSAARAVEDA
jgi:DNA-binding PadR family transcriptional regulator